VGRRFLQRVLDLEVEPRADRTESSEQPDEGEPAIGRRRHQDCERHARRRLKSLGKPAIPRGEEARDVVDQLATDIKGDSDKISDALSNVSTVADIVDAASVLSTTLAQLETQVRDAANDLKAIRADEDNSLNQAFADAPACADLESIS
jgi:hypothetical protein